MSNSIWHKYDIKDIPNPHHEILAWTGSKHAVVIIKPAEWRSGDCDWIESWAYIQDVLTQADKAERLLKVVFFLSGHLRDVLQLDEYGHIKLDEITKQQIKTAISDPVGIITQLEQESNN